jgi:hypothetical protein
MYPYILYSEAKEVSDQRQIPNRSHSFHNVAYGTHLRDSDKWARSISEMMTGMGQTKILREAPVPCHFDHRKSPQQEASSCQAKGWRSASP